MNSAGGEASEQVTAPTRTVPQLPTSPSGRIPHQLGCAVTLCVLALAVAAPLGAQPLEPDVGDDGAGRNATGNIGGRVGSARMAEDWYLTITPSLYLEIPEVALTRDSPLFDAPQVHPLRMQFEAPLFVRVRDNAPQQSGSAFRREQWDEPAEYARILRWIEYGRPYDGIYFRGGELSNVRVGHRSIVDAYDNSLDTDHFQWGLQHHLNTTYGGVETFLDNVTDPDVMALRLWARPWAFADPGSTLRRLAVGATIAADQNAPTELDDLPGGAGFEADARGNIRVVDTDATAILGWDVEYQLVSSDRVSLTPYSDANTHLGRGTGWHVGAFSGFKLSETVVLDLRAEYRLLGRGYLPAYIGRIYEVERLTYLPLPGDELPAPKLTWSGNVGQGRRSGYYAELGFNFAERLYIAGGWEDQTGANNNAAWAQLRVPALSILQFGAYFVNTRFEGAAGLVDLDNALAVAELRVSPLPWLYVDGQFRRRWDVGTSGEYVPVNDWWFGAGVSFGF